MRTSSKSSGALPIGMQAITALLRDARIAFEHARDITRRHASDQCGTAHGPRLQEIGQAIRTPRTCEWLVHAGPTIDPRVLVVDAERQAIAPMDHAAYRREEVGRDRHQDEIDLPTGRQPRQHLVATAKRPHANVADQPDWPCRHRGRVNDPQARRDQPLEIGIRPFFVEGGIAGDDDRLPAEFRQIARPQPRPMGADQVAGCEMAADEGNAPQFIAPRSPPAPACKRRDNAWSVTTSGEVMSSSARRRQLARSIVSSCRTASHPSSIERIRKPSTPGRTISVSEPRGQEMIGVPQASASAKTIPNGSFH